MKPYWSLPLIMLFLHLGVFCSVGQGIRVASAYYGSPNGLSVDVTRRVQQFADYGEPFRVGKETLKVDPSPKHRKALVVIYEVSGRRISDTVLEGDVFYFRNAEQARHTTDWHRPDLRIKKAIYGTRGRYVDVTNRVRELARGRQVFTVSNRTLGVDPAPGQKKWLKISYLRGNRNRSQQYADGDRVSLK
jgi:hypothetical protein